MRLRVATAQTEVRELDIQHNKFQILKLLKEAKNKKVDIVCFCEGSLTGWFVDTSLLSQLTGKVAELDAAMAEIKQACGKHRITSIVGQIKPDQGRFRNEAVAICEKGSIRHVHSKRMLTSGEAAVGFNEGQTCDAFDLAGVMCGVAICFEFEDFSEPCDTLCKKGAQIIFNPKHHRSPPGTWKSCACETVMCVTQCRAKALQLPVVSVNRAVEESDWEKYFSQPDQFQMSHSCIIGPKGLVLASSYPLSQALAFADLEI